MRPASPRMHEVAMVVTADLIPDLERCVEITALVAARDEAALQIFARVDRELRQARSIQALVKINDPIKRAREMLRIRREGV